MVAGSGPQLDRTFFEYPIKLKSVKRAGWSSKLRLSHPESVADHTFSMCILGMVLSDIEGLDTERVMKMTLIHDLAESITGDLLPGALSKEEKIAAENKAMKTILSLLPQNVQTEYLKLWQEYVDGVSETAQFVHRIDKLEMALQAHKYLSDGSPRQVIDEFFESAESAIMKKDDRLGAILKSLRAK